MYYNNVGATQWVAPAHPAAQPPTYSAATLDKISASSGNRPAAFLEKMSSSPSVTSNTPPVEGTSATDSSFSW